jgi:hypothetical protein
VTVAGEHGLAEPLPSRRRVPAVAHSATADGSRRSVQTRPSRSTSSLRSWRSAPRGQDLVHPGCADPSSDVTQRLLNAAPPLWPNRGHSRPHVYLANFPLNLAAFLLAWPSSSVRAVGSTR